MKGLAVEKTSTRITYIFVRLIYDSLLFGIVHQEIIREQDEVDKLDAGLNNVHRTIINFSFVFYTKFDEK